MEDYKKLAVKTGPNAPPEAQQIRDKMKAIKDKSYKEWDRLKKASKRLQASETKVEQAIHLMQNLH